MIPDILIHLGLILLGALSFIFTGFAYGALSVITCAPEDIGKYHTKWKNRNHWKFYLETFIICFTGFTLFHFANKF